MLSTNSTNFRSKSKSKFKSVLIVGGGLAGLSAAIALAQQGIYVEVIDQVSQWPITGAGLTLGAATLRALDHLAVLDQVVQHGHTHDGIQVCAHDGRYLNFIKSPPVSGSLVPGAGGILRSKLQEILLIKAKSLNISLQLGLKVEHIEQFLDTVHVRLTDGRTQEWTLVVGADGQSSAMRQKLFPKFSAVNFTGQGCWRTVLPRPPLISNRHFFLGGPHKVGLTPVSDKEMYLFLLEHIPNNPRRDTNTQHEVLANLLKDYGGPLADVRNQLSAQSPIVYRPLDSHFISPRWYQGRVVLIGDAAHATTPQLAAGAGMGIEDGLVLADELGRTDSIEQALQAFMDRRLERCRLVVENSLRIGELEVQGASPEIQTTVVVESLKVLAQPI